MDIYREEILDHFKRPRNFGRLRKGGVKARQANASCGDEIKMEVRIEEGRVKEVKFEGKGCAISTAAASMLTEKIADTEVEKVKQMGEKEMIEMLGIEISPARKKCATLALLVLKEAIKRYEEEK